MEVKTVKEKPIFTLEYSDWENYWSRDVYVSELKSLNVGDILDTHPERTSARSVRNESYEAVYKNDNGVAMLHREFFVGSYPDFRESENVEIVWFELH